MTEEDISEGDEKLTDDKYLLKAEPGNCADGLDEEHERTRGVKDNS